MTAAPEFIKVPLLVVDLDGTLHADDIAGICIKTLIVTQPWLLAPLLIWLSKSRLYMKHKLAKHIKIDFAKLDWNKQLIEYLQQEQKNGTRLVLASAAVQVLANEAAAYLTKTYQLEFYKVLGSSEKTNLFGHNKAQALSEIASDNQQEFSYVGDSPSQDTPVFKSALVCHFVNPTDQMLKSFQSDKSKVFVTDASVRCNIRRWLLTKLQQKP